VPKIVTRFRVLAWQLGASKKRPPLNMGVSTISTPYIAVWKFAILPKISANGQMLDYEKPNKFLVDRIVVEKEQ